jgi:hypothetical protein
MRKLLLPLPPAATAAATALTAVPASASPPTPVTGTFAVVSVTPPAPRHTTQAVSKKGRGGHDVIDEQVLAGPASPPAAR